jgi:hypothetical protein
MANPSCTTSDNLTAWETEWLANNGPKKSPATWYPNPPRWRGTYPTAQDCDAITELVHANNLGTIYYRGLADELLIAALIKGNPQAEIAVWDFWGYWSNANSFPWGNAKVLFHHEGAPFKFPDLLIIDSDVGAKEICSHTNAQFIALAGNARKGMPPTRYAWKNDASFSIGKKKRQSTKGRDAAIEKWRWFFD